jgi:hypothetical protein
MVFRLFIPLFGWNISGIFEFGLLLIKVRARFCSFGAVGECAKHAYAPSPTAHNIFFLQARPKRKTFMCS